MAINQRLPTSVKDSRELNDAEEKFVSNVERDNYSTFNEIQLVDEYLSIDRQSQLLKGKILLVLRDKFPSNNEFSEFIEKHLGTICSDTRQSRTRYMNLARFFSGGREMGKIGLSAAYEISAPINADIAVEVYEYAKDKNLPLAEVRRQIALKKGIPNTSVVPTSVEPIAVVEKTSVTETVTEPLPVEISPSQIVTNSIATDITPVATESATDELAIAPFIVNDVLKGFGLGEKLKILRDCLTMVNAEMRP
jgi:hypothetical protein